ncbi:gasdermin-A isoform X2 [Rhineura floridana]|uniref:gasdermin-A isoform X2 n=1 Tax=Rhineura floridana TaxID=261503 RepID=UPI002AC8329B|nr:gasdermin-A isoform X2 [Rhineura floridana]
MSFHKATKSLAKQLDPTGDLIPVQSVIDQNHFRPLCLVQRKRRRSWWETCPYHKTEYRLCDVLLSGDHAAKLDVQDSGPITVVNQVDGTVEGDFGGQVDDLTTVEVKGATTMSHARSVKVKKIHVCPQLIDSVTREGKINLKHEFIKQSRMIRRDLYVITEAVEAVEEAEFGESNKAEGSMFYKTCISLKLKGARGSKKAIIIPKSCILAFRAKQLLIKEREAHISYYHNDKTGTFVVSENKSKVLQREVERKYQELFLLSVNLRGKFLTGFLAIMRETDFLQELELQLEQALESHNKFKLKTGKPELQDLVDNLQDSNGYFFRCLIQAVLYFFRALDELTEFQRMLLVESVEKKIVNRQLVLVGSILDNDFSEKEKDFTVEAQLLSEEDLNITGEMVEMSGLTVKKNGSSLTGTGNPATFSALAALYVALYALSALSTEEDGSKTFKPNRVCI